MKRNLLMLIRDWSTTVSWDSPWQDRTPDIIRMDLEKIPFDDFHDEADRESYRMRDSKHLSDILSSR